MCLDQTAGCFMSPYVESVIEQGTPLSSEVATVAHRGTNPIEYSEPLFFPSLWLHKRQCCQALLIKKSQFMSREAQKEPNSLNKTQSCTFFPLKRRPKVAETFKKSHYLRFIAFGNPAVHQSGMGENKKGSKRT